MKKSDSIIILFSLILFFLVISVIYSIISISDKLNVEYFQAFMPLVVFSGFFIFLIAAMLFALVIFNRISRLKEI